MRCWIGKKTVMSMANKRVREVYNDGIFKIKKQATVRNEAGKKTGVTDKTVACLRFRNMTIRESDITTMQALDSKITKKIKTPIHPINRDFTSSDFFAVIGASKYNVTYVDTDDYSAFWYLEKVGDYTEREREDEAINSND